MIKKFTSLLLVLCMVLTLMPVSAFAAGDNEADVSATMDVKVAAAEDPNTGITITVSGTDASNKVYYKAPTEADFKAPTVADELESLDGWTEITANAATFTPSTATSVTVIEIKTAGENPDLTYTVVQVKTVSTNPDQAAVDDAKAAIKKLSFEFAQADVNTADDVKTAVLALVNAELKKISFAEVEDTAITIKNFEAAVAGNETTAEGTDGSFDVEVTLTSGEATDTASVTGGKITATAYTEVDSKIELTTSNVTLSKTTAELEENSVALPAVQVDENLGALLGTDYTIAWTDAEGNTITTTTVTKAGIYTVKVTAEASSKKVSGEVTLTFTVSNPPVQAEEITKEPEVTGSTAFTDVTAKEIADTIAAAKADKPNEDVAVVIAATAEGDKAKDVTTSTVALPKEAVESLATDAKKTTIKTNVGDVTIPKDAFAQVLKDIVDTTVNYICEKTTPAATETKKETYKIGFYKGVTTASQEVHVQNTEIDVTLATSFKVGAKVKISSGSETLAAEATVQTGGLVTFKIGHLSDIEIEALETEKPVVLTVSAGKLNSRGLVEVLVTGGENHPSLADYSISLQVDDTSTKKPVILIQMDGNEKGIRFAVNEHARLVIYLYGPDGKQIMDQETLKNGLVTDVTPVTD